jgi:hypothetical protein
MPSDELDLSRMAKVMESLVYAVTFQKRNDQLLVPLWSVLPPSLSWVVYVVPLMLYLALPMRLA